MNENAAQWAETTNFHDIGNHICFPPYIPTTLTPFLERNVSKNERYEKQLLYKYNFYIAVKYIFSFCEQYTKLFFFFLVY